MRREGGAGHGARIFRTIRPKRERSPSHRDESCRSELRHPSTLGRRMQAEHPQRRSGPSSRKRRQPLIDRSFDVGSRWACEHPRGAAMFTFGLCVLLAVLCLLQAAWHWEGPGSAVALTVGLLAGAATLTTVVRTQQTSSQRHEAALIGGNVLGAVAAMLTLAPLRVGELSGLLATAQMVADGYLAAACAGLIPFVQWGRSPGR